MVPAKRSGFPVIKKSGNLSFFCNISSLSGVKYADSPQGSVHGGAGAGGKKGVAPLNKGLSPTGDWGWTDRISVAGPFRAAPERQ